MGYFLNNVGRVWETLVTSVGSHLTLSLGGILFLGFPVAFWGGAYSWAITARAGAPLLVAFAVGIVTSALFGALFAFFYGRVGDDSFAVITLATMLAVEALIRSWDSLTGGVLGIAGVSRPSFTRTLGELVILQGVVAGVALSAEALLILSPFGRSLRGLKENKVALTALGTSAKKTGQVAVLFASLWTGVGGVVSIFRVQFLDPSFGGVVLLIQVLTIAIIANTPSVRRLSAVAVGITLLPEVLRFFNLPISILGYMRNLLYASVLIILIYYVMQKMSFRRYV